MSLNSAKIRPAAVRILLLTAVCVSFMYVGVHADDEGARSDDKVYSFLARSAFIGNSIGEGLTMYNKAKDRVPLGEATMLTKGSYSFANDQKANTRYLPKFDGVPMQAKDAVKKSGASYVFVCMGTNDLTGRSGARKAYDNYRKYLAGIMDENPEITLFIESCPPTAAGAGVNNEKVTEFNGYMRSYCNALPNIHYIDIAGALSDESGYLSRTYSSGDGIHLSGKAYAVWAETVHDYIAGYIEEKAARIRKKNELEHAAARRNYEKCMRQMEEAKLAARNERLKAEKDEAGDDWISPMTPESFRRDLREYLQELFQIPPHPLQKEQPAPQSIQKFQALLQ